MRPDQLVVSSNLDPGLDAQDLELSVGSPHNVLVQGPHVPVQGLLSTMMPSLRQPVAEWGSGPFLFRCGTLLVRDAVMSPEEQLTLLDWIGRTYRRTRVITLSSVRLYSCVQRGEFLSDLYYRLNTIFIGFRGLD